MRFAGTTLLPPILLSFCLLSVLPASVGAQPFEQYVSSSAIVVEDRSGRLLPNPFSGGLDLARIGLVDHRGSGRLDLWTYNLGGEMRRYENRGDLLFVQDTSSAIASLPVRSWFRFFDIDGDDRLDLFTSGSRSELLMLRNVGIAGSLEFAEADTVRTEEGTTIFTEQLTVPGFVDIDDDGDSDLFSGNIDGTISFYENVGTATDPSFRFRTSRYEGLLVLSPAGTKKEGRDPTVLHGASVLDFVDLDGDDDLDILFGDFFTRGLLQFENRGDRRAADFDTMWVDTAFAPNSDRVLTAGFNQAVSGKLDDDEDIDILVASLLASAFAFPVELYENRGTPTAPQMRRVPGIVTGEIDLGRRAAPAMVADRERTGLIVGAEDGSLTWFLLGGQESGARTLTEERRFLLDGVTLAAPAAGDLDGDGRAEIVVGKSDALDGTTMRLYRFDDEGDLVRIPWQLDTTFNIVRSGASPALVDIDGDDDLDLFVGGRNGRFSLFENVGSPAGAIFEVATPPAPFDTLDLGSNAAPRFFDLDGDGDPDAIVGSRDLAAAGTLDTLRFWRNDEGVFREDPAWGPIIAGQYPVPTILVAEGHRQLLVGSGTGGVLAFRGGEVDLSSVSPEVDGSSPDISLDGRRLHLLTADDLSGRFELFDLLGRRHIAVDLLGSGRSFDLGRLSSGIYLWRYEGTAGRASGRIVLTDD